MPDAGTGDDRPLVALVASEVRSALTVAADRPEFLTILEALLSRPGRILAPRGPAKWPIFVFAACRACGGEPALSIGPAAAVEFAVAAADAVDDLVDDEWEGSVPWGRALNATAALPWLAQRCIQRVRTEIEPARAARIGRLIGDGYLAAAGGEDLDLELEARAEPSEEMAYEMTRRKSGALLAMACRVGAAVATDDPIRLDLVGRFGEQIGVIAQLLNDLAGVEPGQPGRGSDLRRGKKTLPVAFALRCVREEGVPDFPAAYYHEGPLDAADEEHIARAIRDLGGAHYAWVVADAHRREAFALLDMLEQTTGDRRVRRLRRLIPAVRPREGR